MTAIYAVQPDSYHWKTDFLLIQESGSTSSRDETCSSDWVSVEGGEGEFSPLLSLKALPYPHLVFHLP